MEKDLKKNGDSDKEDTIKVQNKYAQEEFQEKAGYLGTLMQMAYLVHFKSSLYTRIFCSSSTFWSKYFMDMCLSSLYLFALLLNCLVDTS